MGGRKKLANGAKQERQPPVSEAWGTLTDTTVSMLEMVAFLHEGAGDDCNYHISLLVDLNKHRKRFDNRMQLLDGVARLIEGYMPAFCEMDAEQRMEHGVAELWENFYGSVFTIISEYMEAYDKVKSQKLRVELQQQVGWLFRVFAVLIHETFSVDRASALDSIKPFVKSLFDICCSRILLNLEDRYPLSFRKVASEVMALALRSKNLNPLLSKDGEGSSMVKLVIDTCFKLCADGRDTKGDGGGGGGEEEEGSDNDNDNESENESGHVDDDYEEFAKVDPTTAILQNLGTQLLAALASSVIAAGVASDPPASFLAAPLILAKAHSILNDESSNKDDRKAALICLAGLPEAAAPFVKQAAVLSNLMSLLRRCMSSNEASLVRAAAFISLCEHVEHLQPEVAIYHDELIQQVMQVVKDPPEVSSALLKSTALQLFCVLKKLPAKYLQAGSSDNLAVFILDQVKSLINSKPVHTLSSGDRDMLTSLLDGLSTFVDTYVEAVKESTLPDGLGKYFEPHAGDAFNVAISLLEHATGDDSLLVRARAAALIGSVVACQSKEQIQQQMEKLAPLITSAFEYEPDAEEDEGLPEDLHILRASLYCSVGVIAHRLGTDVEQYVESLIPFFCRTMTADYGGAAADGADDEEDEEDDGHDEDESSKADEDEPSGVDEERQHAIECFKDLVTALGPRFIPFNERVLGVLSENAKIYAADVRKQLACLLDPLVTMLYPPPAAVAPLSQVGIAMDLSVDATNQLKKVRTILFDYVEHGTDSEVMESALDAIHSLMKTYGQRAIDDEEVWAEVQQTLIHLLRRVGDDEEEEEEEEEAEEEEEEDVLGEAPADASFFYSLCDVIGALAKLKGPALASFLDEVWPQLFNLHTQERYYRIGVNGLFADLAESGELFTPKLKQVLEVLVADINTDKFDTNLWRNTAFALGQIFLRQPIDLTQQALKPAADAFQARLTQLDAAITKKQDEMAKDKLDAIHGCRDNIISAIGKMLMVGSAHLPLDRLVPLFVSSLPLTSDYEEHQPTLAACSKLIAAFPSAHPGVIERHFATLLKLFATVVATMGENEKVSDRVKKFVVQSARNILTMQPSLRAELVDKAEDENMKALRSKIDEAV